MVNGMPVNLPKSYSGSGLTLEKVGLFVSLSSRHGVTLLWDGGTVSLNHILISPFLILPLGFLLRSPCFRILQPL